MEVTIPVVSVLKSAHSIEEPNMVGSSILIVEDDEGLASVLKRALEEEQYLVKVAPDGNMALQLLALEEFDAVVLDLMLPFVTGMEVCNKLRKDGNWIPILMVTALGEVQDRIQGFEAGADDYLAKPFSLAELLVRVKAIIRRSHIGRPCLLKVGDIQLDPVTKKVWRGDLQVDLAPREAELLEFFLRRPGIVLTRSTILKGVWGQNCKVAENIVDQYIGHLRRKIDRPFGHNDLETVHCLGYKLRIQNH